MDRFKVRTPTIVVTAYDAFSDGNKQLDLKALEEQLRLQHPNRVLAAARTAPCPRPTAFTCKSVCDFADERKDDRWQAYAAYTSARAVQEFFERYMSELSGIPG